MHSEAQAQQLWCPMARVAQAGNADIHVAYNRTLTKNLMPVKLKVMRDPEEFDLGQEPTDSRTELILDMVNATSRAAHCLGSRCAVWRWMDPEIEGEEAMRRGYCGLTGWPGK